MMVFLFDENVPFKFVDGLVCIEAANHKSNIQAKILSPKILNKLGVKDEEIIELAGLENAIIFSFDTDFKHQKSYYPLYKQHNVGVIFMELPKKHNYWTIVKLIINNWEEVKEAALSKQKPFALQIRKFGIQSLNF